MRDWEDIKLDVLTRLDMKAVAELCGVVLRRDGAHGWKSACPFHADKSPSFVVGGKKGMEHRGHCFGCGWDGDIFSFWRELKGCDFKTALGDLASVAGVPMGDEVRWTRPDAPRVRVERRPASERPEHEMPSLPPLRHMRGEECEAVARGRGLDAEAVWLAARTFKRIAFSMWPLYESHSGEWLERSVGAFPSWCAIDETRNVAEFRRVDNGKYVRQDGGEIKAWSTCGKSWPLGAGAMNGRPCVLLVEGGPDMLAAYHFLRRFRMLERVAVVCMLGAGNKIREDALGYFSGKRVRIMVDADPLKDVVEPKMRKLPGMEAAARWSGQLAEAGAVVETFCVGPVYDRVGFDVWSKTWGPMWSGAVPVLVDGLRMADGGLVKDVNELALCGPEVLRGDEVGYAFRSWDF